MKKNTVLLLLAVLAKIASAQITLEHTYNTASVFQEVGALYMVKLEVSGEKYVRITQNTVDRKTITLYNMDHSVFKSINCRDMYNHAFGGVTAMQNWTNFTSVSVMYISEHLFNADDSLEFMLTYGSNVAAITGIFNEAGHELFVTTEGAPAILLNVPQAMKPIYNTSQGTKMILSMNDGTANVYSIPGTITTEVFKTDVDAAGFELSPNPSNNFTKVNFALPAGIATATIRVNDLAGRMLREYEVDNTFNNLLISNTDLATGTYVFSLVTNQGVISKQQIVVH